MAADNASPAPMTGVSAHLTIPSKGGPAAIEFYQRAFGAVEVRRMPAQDGERLMHAQLIINGCSVLLADEFPEYNGEQDITPKGVTLHLQVDDADEWWNRAILAGGVPLFPLEDQFWGDRYGQLKDPFGHTWSIGAPIRGR